MRQHVTFRAFISGSRSNFVATKWQAGKMPKGGANALSLSKSRAIKLGAEWRWTHIGLDVDDMPHRIWICYHQRKENYMAVACKILSDGDHLVVGVLEHHGTHPGWHVHGSCKNLTQSSHGRLRYPEMVRIPEPGSAHRASSFPSDDTEAMDIAGRHFRIQELRQTPELTAQKALF